MKTIYLLRHAKAEEFDEKIPDKERRLTKDGVEDSKVIAKQLKEISIRPDLILTSDTSRSIETAKIFSKKFKIDGQNIAVDQEVFSADSRESLFNLVKRLDDKFNSVMIVGHNPSLSALANLLADSFTFDLPKAGMIAIECDSYSWSDIIPDKNRIKFFIAPLKKKKVRRLKKELATTLENKIETSIVRSASEAFAGTPPRTLKLIKKMSRTIAEEYLDTMEYPLLKTIDQIYPFYNQHGTESEDKGNTSDNMPHPEA